MRINPRNFYPRKLDKLPPHFVKMELRDLQDKGIDLLSRWIYQNCYGRFAIIKELDYRHDKTTESIIVVGFEEHSDLTLFALSGQAHKG
jgi:hypothetical protein